jgi:hypothetical protein
MTEINPHKPCVVCIEPTNDEGSIDMEFASVSAYKNIDDAMKEALESVADRGGRRYLFVMMPVKMIEATKPRVVDIGG